MEYVVKIFKSGRGQTVRLPAALHFDTPEVFIRQDPATGDVILSRRPSDWSGFFKALGKGAAPDDFLSPKEREQGYQGRDPLEGWDE